MTTKILKYKFLILILVFSAFIHLFRFDYPNTYVFDEVYHGFTAKEYAKNEIKAWEWWNTPPQGVAYEWTHPPLAKEIMAASLLLFNTEDPWGWRLPGVLLGIISTYLVYLLARKLTQNEKASLLAAAVYSVNGLLLVQARTGMNDIYVVTAMLTSILLLIHKKFFLSSLFLGLALASKWSALYLYGVIFITLLVMNGYPKTPLQILSKVKNFWYFLTVPVLIYLISYIPFFTLGHSIDQFIELQQQMWWYHSGLKATHDYASPWWSWPFNFFPVWYFVEYIGDKTANIFASGNPMMFWFGFMAILMTIYDTYIEKNKKLAFIILGYCAFLLPWALSPRIMFLYHYSPCIPFMSIALGYQLSKFTNSKDDKIFLAVILAIIFISFALVYPYLTGIPLEKDQVELFFKTNITKNPFGS